MGGVERNPRRFVVPSSRQRVVGGRYVKVPQWTSRTELGIVASASIPPVRGSGDYRVPADSGIVGVGEITNPANHSRGI